MNGAQSVLIKNIESYQEDNLKKILRYSRDYTLNNSFLVGEGMDYDRMVHTKLLNKILCTNNCELKDYIWDKINGKLKEKCKKTEPLSKVLKKYEEEFNHSCCTDTIGKCVGKIEW